MQVARAVAAFAAFVVLQPAVSHAEPVAVAVVRPPVVLATAAEAALARAVAAPFAANGLGKRVAVSVLDAASGRQLYRKDAAIAVLPASTLKLVTAAVALTALPPDTTLRTKVVTAGSVAGGVLTGDLVLVGGGDPTLSSLQTPSYPSPSRLSGLVEAVRRRGIISVTGNIVVDSSAYSGPLLQPDWKPTYVTEGAVAPVSALMVDGAHSRPGATRGSRSSAPDLLAGQRFSAMLKAKGVTTAGGVTRGTAPPTAQELGAVESAPLAALVERMLQRSDNDLAEALLRRAATEKKLPASFSGGADLVRATLHSWGLPTAGVSVVDGSGLSRANRVTTDLLAGLLRLATSSTHTQLRPLLSGLPTAGFNGTLVRRFRDSATRAAAGQVRAKTGTLNNVTTLAGTVVTDSGQLLVFAASADEVPTAAVGGAARLLDKAIAAIAACGCP